MLLNVAHDGVYLGTSVGRLWQGHLGEWKSNTRLELQPFVGKIAAVLGVS